MAKAARTAYVCQACGHKETKWLGRCPSCSEWSSLIEELQAPPVKSTKGPLAKAVPLSLVTGGAEARMATGIAELDRVLGGGLVRGALVLVGGDPGIGKSTLLLQAMGALAKRGERVLYLSAEESGEQVKLRADRLGLTAPSLYFLADTTVESL